MFACAGNPLECGCDVLWLLNCADCMERLDESTCADGTLLTDLDPQDLADVC